MHCAVKNFLTTEFPDAEFPDAVLPGVIMIAGRFILAHD